MVRQNKSSSGLVVAGALLACALWSSALPTIKVGLKYAFPFFFAAIRFMIAGVLLLPFCLAKLRQGSLPLGLVLRVAFFQTFLLYGLFYLGMTFVSGALGAIMVGSSPLIIAVVAHFATHDDKMTLRKIFCFVLGSIGIVVISLSRKPWTSSGWQELIGIFLLLGGSVASAFGNLIVSKNRGKSSAIVLTCLQMFLGGVMLLLLSFVVEGAPKVVVGSGFFLSLGWLAFISATAFSIWFVLLRKEGVAVSELNLWKFVIPVFGSLLSWQFVPGERLDSGLLVGMVIISLSILFYYARLGRRPADI